jgi:RNA polymerase sigma factor (sigma-70 family)
MNRNSEQGMQTDMDVEQVLTDEQARELVIAVVSQHADSLLRTARRHSLCADDAQDAYQRTMEIFVRRARTLDPAQAYKWVHTVCKHEAMAVREQRQQLVSCEEPDLDREEARNTPSPEERIVSFDRLRRSAEALQRLKPHELRALWLKAEGFTYDEISRQTGWTYTKVNRCITEGRRAFMAAYARIEGGAECERWLPLLSAIVDGEATSEQLIEIRPHLRNCAACRATVRELHATSAPLAALLPAGLAPAAAAHGHGLLARVFEAVTGGIHDRAASAALKFQAAVETASAGKLAAVAASAAAIAGGGAVVVDGATTPNEHHSPAVRAQPVAPVVTAVVAPPRPAVRRAPSTAPRRKHTAARHSRREFRTSRSQRSSTEFASATTATIPPPAPAPAASSTVVQSSSAEPAGSGREFTSEFGG